MLNIVVMVSGGGTNLAAIIKAIEHKEIQNTNILAVISNNEGAYALERAKNAGILALCISPKDFESRDKYNETLTNKMKELSPDLIVLAGCMVKIPESLVNAFKIINIHPALIPSFCGVGFYGLKVHEAALERGVKITGATVHFVDNGVDTGPIILQKAVEVKEGDTPEILQRRVMEEAEWIILPKAINMIANGEI